MAEQTKADKKKAIADLPQLSIDKLDLLQEGITQQINTIMEDLVTDCIKRGGVIQPRSLKLSIDFTPAKNETNPGVCEVVDIGLRVNQSKPRYKFRNFAAHAVRRRNGNGTYTSSLHVPETGNGSEAETE